MHLNTIILTTRISQQRDVYDDEEEQQVMLTCVVLSVVPIFFL